MRLLFALGYLFAFSAVVARCQDAKPRRVRVEGRRFVLVETNESIVMSGPNVVVKGPPYLPSVSGDTPCNDMINATCAAAGTCTTCFTFNEADIALIKAQGRNTIRLSVVWAGAQPRDENSLDPDFLSRLHAILDMTDREGIHVMLDNHGDMTASAGCGNGLPMWFSQKAAPELIGLPLVTGFPFNIARQLRIENVPGYDHCGDDKEKWARYAGDPNYNLLNECCLAMNGPNPGGIGYTTIAQKNIGFMIAEGEGRDDFVRFWRLVAEAVKGHPSAFAIEPMNEPMSINRRNLFDTWRAVSDAVTAIVPDMNVAIADVGEGAVLPGWFYDILDVVSLPYIAPSKDTVSWMRSAKNLFFAWHWYGAPKKISDAITHVREVEKDWNMPSFATEFFDCRVWTACEQANISHMYWHYSCYCNTGADFGNRTVPTETFGGCMLGWAGGGNDRCSSF